VRSKRLHPNNRNTFQIIDEGAMGPIYMVLIFVTGMPGSGKGECITFLKDRGFTVKSLGDIVRNEVKSRGIPTSAENVGKTANDLRKELGQDILAIRLVEEINKISNDQGKKGIVVDGVRSLSELKLIKTDLNLNTLTIAVHTAPDLRYSRLLSRGRDDDKSGLTALKERDSRELGYGLGDVIATADYMIINKGSLEELKNKMQKVFESLNQHQ